MTQIQLIFKLKSFYLKLFFHAFASLCSPQERSKKLQTLRKATKFRKY